MFSPLYVVLFMGIYLLTRWINSMRVVFSIDFTRTLILGVMGEFASLRGLKFKTAFKVRLEVLGLVRMSTERVFRVASTSTASLFEKRWLAAGYSHAGCVRSFVVIPAVIL